MIPCRSIGKAIGRVLIGVLLFAQFAVAGYACPSLQRVPVAATTAVAAGEETTAAAQMASMPACDLMDTDAANLCLEHCRQGQQNADTTATPQVSPGIATLLYLLPIEPPCAFAANGTLPRAEVGLAAVPEPPHAILHCVFRI
jgi:hypothetical protein